MKPIISKGRRPNDDEIADRRPWEEEWEFLSGAYPDQVDRMTGGGKREVVCDIWHDGNEVGQFVSAAPDLYRALEEMIRTLSFGVEHDASRRAMFRRAESDLRKARGE